MFYRNKTPMKAVSMKAQLFGYSILKLDSKMIITQSLCLKPIQPGKTMKHIV